MLKFQPFALMLLACGLVGLLAGQTVAQDADPPEKPATFKEVNAEWAQVKQTFVELEKKFGSATDADLGVEFDPSDSKRAFRMVMLDHLEALIMPDILSQIQDKILMKYELKS